MNAQCEIGLVIYGGLDTISGGYLYDRKLVDYLRRQGDQVEVISLPWRNYASHLSDNLSPGLIHRLADLDVDLLLQDELNHPSLFWLNQQLRRQQKWHGSPVVAIIHHLRASELHPAWQLALYRRIERWYLLTLDGFIYNSQTTRQAVAELTGCDRPGIIAFPAGDQFQPQMDSAEITSRAVPARTPAFDLRWQLDPSKRVGLFTGCIESHSARHSQPDRGR